jgi:PAS domain-containing protein
MIGQPSSRLLPPGHEDDEAGDSGEATPRRDHQSSCETVRRRKDGRTIQVSLMISPILDARGNKVVGVIKDSTLISLAEEAARTPIAPEPEDGSNRPADGRHRPRLQQPARRRSSAILICSSDRLPENQAASKRVQVAQKAAARGADLTRRMLSLASNMEDLNPVNLKLDDAIQEMIELAEPRARPGDQDRD